MGGIVGGQTLKFALVERDGRWQVDEVLSFFDLDEEKLAMEWGRLQLLLATSPAEVEGATCVLDRLLGLSEASLEAMYLDRDLGPGSGTESGVRQSVGRPVGPGLEQ